MLFVKIECERISVEKLAELLFVYVKRLNVWLYKKKIYASFFVESLSLLKGLIKTLESNGIKFRFYRLEEVDYEKGN
ncbi:MAG: hypothetical protein QW321_01405 [Candidatus Aenigmatarchaeota archaeon]